MSRTKRPEIRDEEQAVLDGVRVREIVPDERERFDAVVKAEHYLHTCELVGEQLR